VDLDCPFHINLLVRSSASAVINYQLRAAVTHSLRKLIIGSTFDALLAGR
jgi:hypothetical protein